MTEETLSRWRYLKSNVVHVDFDLTKTPRERWEGMHPTAHIRYTRGYNRQLIRRLDPAQEQRLRDASR